MYRYEKAIDVVHDGFVKLFNHFPQFKPGADMDNEKIFFAFLKIQNRGTKPNGIR